MGLSESEVTGECDVPTMTSLFAASSPGDASQSGSGGQGLSDADKEALIRSLQIRLISLLTRLRDLLTERRKELRVSSSKRGKIRSPNTPRTFPIPTVSATLTLRYKARRNS